MDFNKFDSVAAAERGGRLHLRDFVTGEPIGEGDNAAIVIVRGTESTSFQKDMKALNEAKMSDESEDGKTMEDLHNDAVKRASALIIGFENISNKDKPLTGSKEDIAWFLKLQTMGVAEPGEAPTFIEQVIAFARDRGRMLGNDQSV